MTQATTTRSDGASITGIDLIAYLTADPARSIAFYRDVLGLTPTTVDPSGRGAEFEFPDGTTFGVWQPEPGEPASGGCVMFAVADIAAAVAGIRGRGGEIGEPFETPACFMADGKDPDGNPLIVHQRKGR